MTENQTINTVDRVDETVVTRQPGYAATEHVVHDVAAERRQRWFYVTRIIWTILGVLEILLGLRFVLKLIAANPNASFAGLVYGLTGSFLAPFAGLIANPASGGMVLEMTTLIAMAVYALAFWIVIRVAQIILDRPSTRRVIRSVREEDPGGTGNERVTHTVSGS